MRPVHKREERLLTALFVPLLLRLVLHPFFALGRNMTVCTMVSAVLKGRAIPLRATLYLDNECIWLNMQQTFSLSF